MARRAHAMIVHMGMRRNAEFTPKMKRFWLPIHHHSCSMKMLTIDTPSTYSLTVPH